MSKNNASLIKIPQSIVEFLDELWLTDFHVVVAILRDGAQLPYFSQRDVPMDRRIPVLASNLLDFMPPEYFKDKKLLLLDDTCYEGFAMNRFKQKLIGLGAKEENITTAAFVVHEDCKEENRPKRKYAVIDRAKYVSLKETIGDYQIDQPHPNDGDHPLFHIRITPFSEERFLNWFSRTGDVSIISNRNQRITRLSIRLTPPITDILTLPTGVDTEGVTKIRVFYPVPKNRAIITLAPIFYPAINCELDIAKLSVTLQDKYVDFLGQFDLGQPTIEKCFACLSNYGSLVLMESLIGKLRGLAQQEGVELKILKYFDQEPFAYEFPQFYRIFYENSHKRLEDINPEELPRDLFEMAERQPKRRIFSILERRLRKDYPFLPSAAYAVAVFIYEKWYEQYKKAGCKEEAPKYGVPYSEILKYFESDEAFVNDSLDELLDEGVIRAFVGRYRFGMKGSEKFCRLYRPGGEYNLDQLAWQASAKGIKTSSPPPEAIKHFREQMWPPELF